MGRAVRVVVATPGGRGPWPSVTLLHGHGGDAANWARRLGDGGLEALAARFGPSSPAPTAAPTRGTSTARATRRCGWRRSSRSSFPPSWPRHLPARTDRAGRAITGLSMGGHGALCGAAPPGVLGGGLDARGGVDLAAVPRALGQGRATSARAPPTRPAGTRTPSSASPPPSGTRPRCRALMVDVGTDDFFLPSTAPCTRRSPSAASRTTTPSAPAATRGRTGRARSPSTSPSSAKASTRREPWSTTPRAPSPPASRARTAPRPRRR